MKKTKERTWFLPPDAPLDEIHKQQLDAINRQNKNKPDFRGVYRR